MVPSSAYAEEINVKSIGLDETTIITVTNESIKDIKSFRIWLSENFNFEDNLKCGEAKIKVIKPKWLKLS